MSLSRTYHTDRRRRQKSFDRFMSCPSMQLIGSIIYICQAYINNNRGASFFSNATPFACLNFWYIIPAKTSSRPKPDFSLRSVRALIIPNRQSRRASRVGSRVNSLETTILLCSKDMVEVPDFGEYGTVVSAPNIRDSTGLLSERVCDACEWVLGFVRGHDAVSISPYVFQYLRKDAKMYSRLKISRYSRCKHVVRGEHIECPTSGFDEVYDLLVLNVIIAVTLDVERRCAGGVL